MPTVGNTDTSKFRSGEANSYLKRKGGGGRKSGNSIFPCITIDGNVKIYIKLLFSIQRYIYRRDVEI